MSRLLACRFCRELFSEDEAQRCPVCGIPLEPLHKLPPSLEVLSEELSGCAPEQDEHHRLPWFHLGHGRGAIAGLALLGLVAFFLPWVEQELPDLASLSGFDLARRGAAWLWGGAVGWFILLPLAMSRRSLAQMRGVRAIATTLALLTALEVLMMLAFPPRGTPRLPSAWRWDVGLFVSALVSLAGAAAALRFGGSFAARHEASPAPPSGGAGDTYIQTPPGKTLH